MESLALWGTIVNALAVIGGSVIGMALKLLMSCGPIKKILSGKQNKKEIPEGEKRNFSDTILKALGLCTIFIGVTGIFKTCDTLMLILSMMIGAIIGESLNLDRGVNIIGDKIEGLTKGRFGKVSEGFVTASLLFCVGAMTVVGSLESGLNLNHETLYAKSMLDFVAAIVFAMSLGIGVTLSSAFVFVFQGSITIFAQWIAPWITDVVRDNMAAVGSLLIIALGLNIIGVTKIKVMNLLPAVFMPILLNSFM